MGKTATKVTLESLAAQIAGLAKSQTKLTQYTLGMAKDLYDVSDEEDEADILPDESMDKDDNGMDYPDGDDMDGGGDGVPYMSEEEEVTKRKYVKGKTSVQKLMNRMKAMEARIAKGFDDTAETIPEGKDSEEGKFGVKDTDDVEGNEDSPAGEGNVMDPHGGDMGEADREEETFGPGGMAYSAMQKLEARMAAVEKGKVVAKAIVPANPDRGNAGSVELTREMETEVKSRSWKDINRFRESVGDIPGGMRVA